MPVATPDSEYLTVAEVAEELAPLIRAHVAQRRVGGHLLDAAAQLGARHWQRLDRMDPSLAMSQEGA
jgi:hypothetical protein